MSTAVIVIVVIVIVVATTNDVPRRRPRAGGDVVAMITRMTLDVEVIADMIIMPAVIIEIILDAFGVTPRD